VLERIDANFEIQALTFTVTRQQGVESLTQQIRAESTTTPFLLRSPSYFSLGGFVSALANLTRLSFNTVAEILHRMPEAKFKQIATNENRALSELALLIKRCIYELLIQTVSYELLELKVQTALTDNTGQLLETIPVSLCGNELHTIHNQTVQALSLYADPIMPVDSGIEREKVEESQIDSVTVFAKLPRIGLETPLGKYNPDFGYAVHRKGDTQALYLVVETKGYNSQSEIDPDERYKIDSAKKFFEALRAEGVPVRFETKINGDRLSSLVAKILNPTTTI
jgi:type III restriction enzyme